MSSFPAACFTTNPDAPARSASAASWASACMVRKITLAAIASALSRRSASSPLMPGMATSVTMTSGRSSPRGLDQPGPIGHGPDEGELAAQKARESLHDDRVVVGEQHGRAARPGLAGSVMSASAGQRHHDADLRAALRLGVDREASSDETDALVEADQAQAASAPRLREVEPAPIVTDGQHQVGPVARHGHPRPGSAFACLAAFLSASWVTR